MWGRAWRGPRVRVCENCCSGCRKEAWTRYLRRCSRVYLTARRARAPSASEGRCEPVTDRSPAMSTLSEAERGLFEQALDLLVRKLSEDESSLGVEFPYVTEPDGSWRTLPASLSAGYVGGQWSHGNWFCGFWIGLLLAAYLWSEDDRFLKWARQRMSLVAPRCGDGNTHDIGFIFHSSAIPAHHITGEATFARTTMRAAEQLRARLIPTPKGAYISSWGPLSDERGRRSSAIDTMANLPLLYWAADYSGDGSFRLAAESHAQMTCDAFVRPNNSTYHAVEYDLPSGERKRGFTFQGYADESCWSRGHAWAVYGFAATARATAKLEYLVLAEVLSEYYLTRLAEGHSMVPFWDFDDPAIPNALRDSSTAGIVASALLDLAAIHPTGAGRADGHKRRATCCGSSASATLPGKRNSGDCSNTAATPSLTATAKTAPCCLVISTSSWHCTSCFDRASYSPSPTTQGWSKEGAEVRPPRGAPACRRRHARAAPRGARPRFSRQRSSGW